MLLTILLAGAITYGVGRLIVRVLGWPRNMHGAMRWALSLVALAVLYSGLPDLWRCLDPYLAASGFPSWTTPRLPRVALAEVVAGLCYVGLAGIGYVGWTRAALAREEAEALEAQVRHAPRRAALPAAPAGDDGFAPVGDAAQE